MLPVARSCELLTNELMPLPASLVCPSTRGFWTVGARPKAVTAMEVLSFGLLGFLLWQLAEALSDQRGQPTDSAPTENRQTERTRIVSKPAHEAPSSSLVPAAEATHTAVASGSWQ